MAQQSTADVQIATIWTFNVENLAIKNKTLYNERVNLL